MKNKIYFNNFGVQQKHKEKIEFLDNYGKITPLWLIYCIFTKITVTIIRSTKSENKEDSSWLIDKTITKSYEFRKRLLLRWGSRNKSRSKFLILSFFWLISECKNTIKRVKWAYPRKSISINRINRLVRISITSESNEPVLFSPNKTKETYK